MQEHIFVLLGKFTLLSKMSFLIQRQSIGLLVQNFSLQSPMKCKLYNFLCPQVIYVFPTVVLQDNFLIFWFEFVEH